MYFNVILRSIKKLVHVKSVQRSDIELYHIKQGLKLHNNFAVHCITISCYPVRDQGVMIYFWIGLTGYV